MATDDPDEEFPEALENARELLGSDDVTAFHVGVVRGGENVETTYSYDVQDPEQEGLQSLTLLATHLRIVAEESGVDYTTAASDAATLAGQVEETPPDE